jgi:hypothetical protein
MSSRAFAYLKNELNDIVQVTFFEPQESENIFE